MPRKFKTKFSNSEIYDYFISEELTAKQLKSLIKSFTENANRIPYRSNERYADMREEIISFTGVTKYTKIRGRRQEIIGYGFSGKNKDDLIEQAQMLQSYIRDYYDTYSTRKDRSTSKSRKSHKTYNEKFGEDTTYDFYETMMRACASISDIMHAFGSDTIQSLMIDFKDKLHPMTIAQLARKVYNNAQGKHKSRYELVDDLLDAILDELSS